MSPSNVPDPKRRGGGEGLNIYMGNTRSGPDKGHDITMENVDLNSLTKSLEEHIAKKDLLLTNIDKQSFKIIDARGVVWKNTEHSTKTIKEAELTFSVFLNDCTNEKMVALDNDEVVSDGEETEYKFKCSVKDSKLTVLD